MPITVILSAVLFKIVLPLVLIFIAYKNYHAVKYYFKFIVYSVAVTVIPIIFMPYFLMRPRNVLNLLPPTGVLRHLSRIIGIKFTVRGDKNLREEKTCVIVSNHQSILDLLELWPIAKKLTVIARMLVLMLGPFGIGSWLCGIVFINKDSKDHGKQKMNDAVERLKSQQTKLWVFPEGYRNHSGQIDEFKKGAFHMAVQGQVPIIPVIMSSYKTFMRRSEKVFDSGEVIIEALPEIPTKGLTASDVNQLMKQTRDLMIKKYEELNREVENKSKSN